MTGTSTTTSGAQNPTYVYVGAFVDELARSGLCHVVICPGSRSTPLALTFAAVPAIRVWMHIDERSAAFFALGMARRLDQPVALLCTSGTAAANFLPAIVEARLAHVPLLVLTSDRPPELHNCGAPQAIDQNRLYGTHAKWFVDAALPEATNTALRYIRTIADRALTRTQALPAGPVHVNMPFREPLTPAPIPDQSLLPLAAREPLAWQGRPANQPYTQVNEAARHPVAHTIIARLARQIARRPRGLIIVGPQADPALADPLLRVARQSSYPILADPLSQLRGAHDLVISSYDAFLRSERFSAHYKPELVLRFGSTPTAKPALLYLKGCPACTQIVIEGQEGWEEPAQLATQVLHADPAAFCEQLCAELAQLEPVTDERTSWIAIWQQADKATRLALSTAINDFTEIFEGRVFTELAELLPAHALLYAGNSMSIRDMDTFFWPSKRPVRCLGNRGASGIDGVVSSALGASAAGGLQEPTVLVIGDLSFFHDLNGLLAAHLHKLNLAVVLVNNNGGGIFSFLPQAAYPEHFEQLFGTPTNLDFRPVVEMYGGTFQRITDWETFRRALKTGLANDGLHVIEVPTERESNVIQHRQLWRVVEQTLEQAGLLLGNEV